MPFIVPSVAIETASRLYSRSCLFIFEVWVRGSVIGSVGELGLLLASFNYCFCCFLQLIMAAISAIYPDSPCQNIPVTWIAIIV